MSERTEVLLLRLPAGMRERIKAVAAADSRSMNSYLVILIRTELARQEALAKSRTRSTQ